MLHIIFLMHTPIPMHILYPYIPLYPCIPLCPTLHHFFTHILSLRRNIYHLFIQLQVANSVSVSFHFVCLGFTVCLFSYSRKPMLSPTTNTKCMTLSKFLNLFTSKIQKKKKIPIHRAIDLRIKHE